MKNPKGNKPGSKRPLIIFLIFTAFLFYNIYECNLKTPNH